MIDSAKLRRLITQAFSEEDLKAFCYDYYRLVYEEFTSAMSKLSMIQILIEYCERRNVTEDLLQKMKEQRPELQITGILSSIKPIAYRFKQDANLQSKEMSYNILYVANIIDARSIDIERQIGTTTDIDLIGIGFIEAIPDGGEQRWYEYENFLLGIDYNKAGVACGIRIEGLENQQLPAYEWHTILHRIGLSARKEPDVIHILHMRWYNYYGCYISVGLNKVGGVINLVRVYKLQV